MVIPAQRLGLIAFTFVVLALGAGPSPARAGGGPTAGFLESWAAAGDLGGWGGGAIDYANPGTGGVLGANDGYLVFSTLPQGGRLGAFTSLPAYSGDWVAAGIRSVRFWLRDVNQDEDLEIHFSIGHHLDNVWQYNLGFDPPHGSWAPFVVDLTDSTRFTRIFFGAGAFEHALRNVNRVHLRHDVAVFEQTPDPVAADVGVDEFEMSDRVVPVAPLTWARLKRLYR